MIRAATFTGVAIAAALAPAAGAVAQSRERDLGRQAIPVQTVPAVSGIELRLGSQVVRTNGRGRARLRVKLLSARTKRQSDRYWHYNRTARFLPPKVIGRKLEGGGEAFLAQFYSEGRIALGTRFPFRPRFVDRFGDPINQALVSSYRLKSRTGTVVEVAGSKSVMLHSSRVVPFAGKLVSKDIEWSVESVTVEGTNVVNRAQQRFLPRRIKGGVYDVQLLFFSARFTSKDAIFGFHVGNHIELTYPNGEVRRHRFPANGKIFLPALPRGEYTVQVSGPGVSPPRPVAVSRPQVVTLKVISWIDLAVVGGALAALALGLLVARRPHLRRIPTRWSRGIATCAVLVAVLAFVGPASASASADATPLYAYYYIWFNPSSWNRAKIDYPLLGRYSSDEATIMRRHIRMARDAGINGFLVSWKSTPVLDERLAKLVAVAEKERFKLGIVYQGLDFERRPLPVEKLAADLELLALRFGDSRAFGGFAKPVVIWSGTWKFSAKEIETVTAAARGELLVLATERNPGDFLRKARHFDGNAYYWSSVNPRTYPGHREKLEKMARAVHGAGGVWIAPAAPGFNARLVGGRTVVPRRDGETLQVQLAAAQQADPDAIGLISWNEFSENTHVEPSESHGTTALEVVADVRGAKLDVVGDLDSSALVGTKAGSGPGAVSVIVGFVVLIGVATSLLRRRSRTGGVR